MLSPEILECLRCPSCESAELARAVFRDESPTDILDGVLWCQDCSRWYPIEERLLDLLVEPLAYGDARNASETISKDQQKLQQDHFDWYADNTDQSYVEYEQTSFWRAADLIAFEPWKRAVTPGSRLLDVGCAQGRSTFKFMDCDIQIVGFDVSKALIRQAIARYQERNHRARAVFFAADASRFPFRDETFDTVLVYGVLHHLADPAAACGEISRVLKPQGSYFGQENNRTVFRSVFDLLQRLRPQWHEEAGPEAIISSEQLRTWFRDTPVEVGTKTSVFLPPHLCNLMPPFISHRMLVASDSLGGAIPYLREHFGLRRHHVLACVCHQAGGDHASRQIHREEGRGRCHNLDGLSKGQFEVPQV